MGNYRLCSLTLIPRKVMEQPTLETISGYIKDRKVFGSSKHRFMKVK